MTSYRRIALVGFSGTGKSTTSRILADRLGWDVADLDIELEREYDKSIPEIFAEDGESAFRASERRHLERALARDDVVISTGGGAVAFEEVWSAALLGRPDTLTVSLDARPETIHARLIAQEIREGNAVSRPMLAGNDPIGRIAALKESRIAYYDRSAVSFPVDRQSAIDVAIAIHTLLDH